MDQSLVAEFKLPPSCYRGTPFWAWNGSIDIDEARRQIGIMKQMGFGGFFIHARVGLETAYLSNEWFALIEECVKEAKKLDMRVWLYDEDRWPSGSAGGLVTRNPQFRRRRLAMEEIGSSNYLKCLPQNTVALFIARKNEEKLVEYQKVNANKLPSKLESDQIILRFFIQVDKTDSWYNGQTYLDTLSHEAVQEFIKTTHDAYKQHLGKTFGDIIPGIFTDEANYGSSMETNQEGQTLIPWTDQLCFVFEKRYGYDILDRLPEVFFDPSGQDFSTVRYHYFDCITFLFTDAFSRQIGEWCENANLLHTGHILTEDTLSKQLNVVGSCMRFYEHMQAPGLDLLTEHWRIYDTVKQVCSVARQFGRKWRLTETYGCTGWDFSFAGHKALCDWQAALGINLRCHHLSWYTMLGEAKRDYPASIFYQSPWWKSYSHVEDYFARIHSIMTKGAEIRDLLVIHPIESIWLMASKGCWEADAFQRLTDFNNMLIDLRDSLLKRQLDFDYGDEDILSRHAQVIPRKSLLKVGQAEYKAVIVPPMRTIRSSTLMLLKSFQEAGGIVVFAGTPPDLVDAVVDSAAQEFAKRCVTTSSKGKKLADAVDKTTRRLSVIDAENHLIPSILYLLKEDSKYVYLFLCHTGYSPKEKIVGLYEKRRIKDRTHNYSAVTLILRTQAAGMPMELEPRTGEAFQANCHRECDCWHIRTSLPAISSRLFVFPKKKTDEAPFPVKENPVVVTERKLSSQSLDYLLSEDNVLVLDRPCYKIGDSNWEKADEILRVDRKIRKYLGISFRGDRMIQPWARTTLASPQATQISLAYHFFVECLPTTPAYLALEKPGVYDILLNGHPLSAGSDCGWWCDKSLRKLPVDPVLLRSGRNELILRGCYDELHSGLEVIYVLGKFGVRLSGDETFLAKLPARLRIGNWCEQGFPFFSGNLGYRLAFKNCLKERERLFVRIPDFNGTAIELFVNNISAGLIAWPPYELDITPHTHQGENELIIQILGHRRNSHGPLRMRKRWPIWTGPNQFLLGDNERSNPFTPVPCGLLSSPILSIRRTESSY